MADRQTEKKRSRFSKHPRVIKLRRDLGISPLGSRPIIESRVPGTLERCEATAASLFFQPASVTLYAPDGPFPLFGSAVSADTVNYLSNTCGKVFLFYTLNVDH